MLTKTRDRGEPIAPIQDELPDLAELDRMVHEFEPGELRLVGPSGKAIGLTESTLCLLRQAVPALADERVVVITHLSQDLPSYNAAELLGMTHAYFLRLLDEGAIPVDSREGIPRVRFEEVMAYKRARDAKRRQILDEMSQESQELEAMMNNSG